MISGPWTGWCQQKHADLGRQRRQLPLPKHRDDIAAKFGVGGNEGYTLSRLKAHHPKKSGVVKQFHGAWAKPHSESGEPTVAEVYQIRNPAAVYDAFLDYQSKHDDNVRRLFHGTSMKCHLGQATSTRPAGPCAAPECAVCNICKTGFDLTRAGAGPLSSRGQRCPLLHTLT